MSNTQNKEMYGPYILPRDPNKAVREALQTFDSTIDICARETELMEQSDTKSFFELQDEKLSVLGKYEMTIQQLRSRENELKDIDSSLKSRLRDMQEKFSEIKKKNLDANRRMQRTVKRLGDTIRNAAKDSLKKQNALSYSETGALEGNDKKRISMGVSETA